MILDFTAAAQWLVAVFVVVAVAAMVIQRAATNFFPEVFSEMAPIGSGSGALVRHPAPICVVCGRSGNKVCSRCKSVRYCSEACQEKVWQTGHRLKCKPLGSLQLVDAASTNSTHQRNRSSGFSSIALVPTSRTCKVLREPKKILFPYDEFVKLFNWEKPGFKPCGLINCGNSCFANVVLQCLASTRPLTAYLLECNHDRECLRKQTGWCFLCELQSHIQRSSKSPHPFSPLNIMSRLRNIGSNLSCGRQEDAHEFMRYAIDTMQSICLDEFGGEDVVEPSSQDTTLIQYIFGGLLQSQVTCTECGTISNRYDKMMDLTVEILGEVSSLEECLNRFTVREWLDGDNMYKCEGCNDYVRAWKRLTVHQAPNILTVALKRFESGTFGKLNKKITYSEILNLSPYMAGPGDGTDVYSLYAVVVHLDLLNASFCGHYICYTKDSQNNWYRIDDCKVTEVEIEEVVSQTAYMLLYSRRNPRKDPFVRPLEPENKQKLAKIESLPDVPATGGHGSHVGLPAVNVDTRLDLMVQDRPAYVSLPMDTDHEEASYATMNFVKNQESESPDSDAVEARTARGVGAERTEDVPFRVSSELVWKDLVRVDKVDLEENLKAEINHVSSDCTGPLKMATDFSSCSDIHLEDRNGLSSSNSGYVPDESPCCSEMTNLGKPLEHSTCQVYSSLHAVECNGGVISGCPAYAQDECSISTEMANQDKPQKYELDLRSNSEQTAPIYEHTADLANEVLNVVSMAPSDGMKRCELFPPSMENGHLRKRKPLFSRGFLDAHMREQTTDLANEVLNVVSKAPSDGMKRSDFLVSSNENDLQRKRKPLLSNGFLDASLGEQTTDLANEVPNVVSMAPGNGTKKNDFFVASKENGHQRKPKLLFSPGFLDASISEQTADLANEVLNVVSMAPSDGTKKSDYFVASKENRHQREPKPLFSRGFLDAPVRKKCSLHRPRSLLQDHVRVSPRVNGYSNRKLEPKCTEDSFQCNNNLISKDSPLTP